MLPAGSRRAAPESLLHGFSFRGLRCSGLRLGTGPVLFSVLFCSVLLHGFYVSSAACILTDMLLLLRIPHALALYAWVAHWMVRAT